MRGRSPARTAKRLLLATRPQFFVASILPVLLGSAWGYHVSGALDAGSMLLALAAIICVHGAVNVLNDVFDELSGGDRANVERIYPYTGGSRFIQNDILGVAQMRRLGIALIGAAVALGAVLVARAGIMVLLFGLAGIVLGTLYSAPPMALARRGLGEAAVAIGFGALPVTGAAWLQSGIVDGAVLLVALPISLWVACILLINEVPDISADGLCGKRTLAVRLGAGGTRALYWFLQAAAVLALAVAVVSGLLPWPACVLPALLLPRAVYAGRAIGDAGRDALRRAIETTLAIHALGGLWLTGVIALTGR